MKWLLILLAMAFGVLVLFQLIKFLIFMGIISVLLLILWFILKHEEKKKKIKEGKRVKYW